MPDMPNAPQEKRDADYIDLKEILTFFRQKKRPILRVALVSLVFTVLLLAVLFLLCPRVQVYSNTITILLEQRDQKTLYPSGRAFSSADLLSRPVLWKVYEDCNLKDQVKFEKFQQSFFISQNDSEIAKVDAQFQAKLNKKNITVVEVEQLEREYREAISRAQTARLTISMIPTFPVGRQQATRILTAIPQAWYEIYSKIEAQQYPQMETTSRMQELSKMVGKDGQLILLEKSRQFCRQLMSMCDLLNKMLMGKNVTLPTGEFLGDIRARLVSVDRYQISVLQQYVLMHPEYQGVFDRIFLESCLQNVELDLVRVKAKYEGAVESLNLITANRYAGTAGAARATGSPLTLQLDNGFFNSIAELIRNDATNDLRKVYAEKTMEYKDQCAELEAEKNRYLQILGVLDRKKTSNMTGTTIKPEQFYTHVRAMFSELFTLGNKVVQFRDQIVDNYLSSRQFCAVSKDVLRIADPVLPLKRLALGILVLWFTLNLGWIFFKFCTRQKNA